MKRKRTINKRSSSRRYSDKKKLFTCSRLDKYYYPYYRGWQEENRLVLFTTPISAMIWQMWYLYKDGYTCVFHEGLPPTFSIIAVLELQQLDAEDGHLNGTYLEETDMYSYISSFTNNSPRKSEEVMNFFQNITFYTTTNESFLEDRGVIKSYLQQMDRTSYENIQNILSHPDYFFSSGSMFKKKVALPSFLNRDCNMEKVNLSTVYAPPCSDDKYGLDVCFAYSIKKSLQNTNALDNEKFFLNNQTIEKIVIKHSKLIQRLNCSKVIISLCSGSSGTELYGNQRDHYVICLDKSKRDICTAQMCNKILCKESNIRTSRVVSLHFDVQDIDTLRRMIQGLYEYTKIQVGVLLQHPTPCPKFVNDTLSHVIHGSMTLVTNDVVSQIVIVYDSVSSTTTVRSNDKEERRLNYLTRQILNEIFLKFIAHKNLTLSEEYCISSKGQMKTLHPLFPIMNRKGWSKMKNKDEYCVVISKLTRNHVR